MAADEARTPRAGRRHIATYARDKKKGGYLVRIAGPDASAFAGRTVPVETAAGEEHEEELVGLVWSGREDGAYGGTAGMPVSLYTFKATPREVVGEVDF